MAKNTIDNFFNDAIADHEWLDAKDKVNAPFATHNPWEAIDTLAMMWTPGNSNADVTVFKPNGDKETVTMDGHIVTETADGKILVTDHEGVKMEKDRKLLASVKKAVQEIKRQMMLGRDLTHIKASVIDKLSPEVKVAAKESIVKLAQEYPLLGSVYIETSPFATQNGVKGCELGASLLKGNQSKMAIYAVKMEKCAGCTYNRGGTCGVYKKQLVATVKYDEKTLDHYQKHLTVARKVASDQTISSKEDLRAALLGVSSGTRQATTVVYHDESKLQASREEKQGSEGVQSKEKREISKDLSLKLASGMDPKAFKDYVVEKYSQQVKAYPEVFQRYASFVGSLGSVFVEMFPFATVHDAANYYKKHAQHVPFILTDGRRLSSVDKTTLGKTVVATLREIPMDNWVKNLRGKSFNAADLSKNPLAVTKMAFLASPPREKKASAGDDMWELDKTLNDTVGEKFSQKNSTHKTQKEFARAKVATKTSSDNITIQGDKVKIKADRGLEIEIEQSSNLDDSIKKYL